jgi:hypothetical protein
LIAWAGDERRHLMLPMRIHTSLSIIALLALAPAGCGDDTSGGPDMAAGADMSICVGGGPVTGAQDNHCMGTFVTVDPAQCTVDAGDTGGGGDDFGDTMSNSMGNDDDCKYFVSFTVTGGACVGTDNFFTVTLKDATTMNPITGATGIRPEIFLTSDGTPVNTSSSHTTEMGNGQYKIGPVHFTSSGDYTIRFHFFEDCTDTETSPHGHAAFFLKVP